MGKRSNWQGSMADPHRLYLDGIVANVERELKERYEYISGLDCPDCGAEEVYYDKETGFSSCHACETDK